MYLRNWKKFPTRMRITIIIFFLFIAFLGLLFLYAPKMMGIYHLQQYSQRREKQLALYSRIVSIQKGSDRDYIDRFAKLLLADPDVLAFRLICKKDTILTEPLLKDFEFDQRTSASQLVEANGQPALFYDTIITLPSLSDRVRVQGVYNLPLLRSSRWFFYQQLAVLFLIALTFYFLFLYLFNRYIYLPLMRTKNMVRMMAGGNAHVVGEEIGDVEFKLIFLYLKRISRRFLRLNHSNQNLKNTVANLDRQLEEKIRSAAMDSDYFFGLFKIMSDAKKSKEGLTLFVAQALVEEGIYDVVISFQLTNEQLLFERLFMRGPAMLEQHLNERMQGFVIPENSEEYQTYLGQSGSILKEPSFLDQFSGYQLTIQFACLAPTNSQLIIVGNLNGRTSLSLTKLNALQLVYRHLEHQDMAPSSEYGVLPESGTHTDALLINKILQALLQYTKEQSRWLRHDFNAPLRNIAGLIDSILRKHSRNLTEDVLARLERIQKNAETGLDMTGRLTKEIRKTIFERPESKISLKKYFTEYWLDLLPEPETEYVQVRLPDMMPDILVQEDVFDLCMKNLLRYILLLGEERTDLNIEIISFIKDGSVYLTFILSASVNQRLVEDQSIYELLVCKNLIGVLDGQISLESEFQKGIKIHINFKNG